MKEKVVHAGTCYLGVKKQLGVTYELQSAGTPLPSLPHSLSAMSTMVLVDTTITMKVRDNFLIGTPGGRFMRVEVLADP